MTAPTVLGPLCFVVLSACMLDAVAAQNVPGFPDFPPDNIDHVMDRDQMMAQLGIHFLPLPPKLEDPNRPTDAHPADEANPEGNWTDEHHSTYTRSGFGLWINYDDDKVGQYTPIDLLAMHDGTRITTADQWWNQRRPELFKDVQEQIWGVMPDANVLPKVTWEVTEQAAGEGALAYTEKTITGRIDTSRYPDVRNIPIIEATLRLPANAESPVPVIVMFGPWGADAVWELLAPQGWGLCMLNPNALQPDNGTGLTSYIIGLVNKGNWRKPDDWGTLVAWTWGVSRLIDYFETDPAVDAEKIGVTGHSRYGKASLVAIAYEPRLAIAYPSCGGALGPSMIRRHWGQDLESIAWDREYHWVAGNFFKWMGPLHEGEYLPRKVELLSVDAHALLALAAPRPVFLNAGTGDTWTDPDGTYLTGVGATPVYELLGHRGLVMPDDKPVIDRAYTQGDIAYRLHDGGHTPMPDWPAFIEFAKKYFEE